MKSIFVLLSLLGAQVTLAANLPTVQTIEIKPKMVNCSTTFVSDPAQNIANVSTIVIKNVYFDVSCSDNSRSKIFIAQDSVQTICKAAGYKTGYVVTVHSNEYGSTYSVTMTATNQFYFTLNLSDTSPALSIACQI